MLEAEAVGVQELPLETGLRHPVHRIAADGQVDRLEMDAQLVRPPRLEAQLQQRPWPEQLANLEPRNGRAGRVGVDRVAWSVAPVASDGGLDAPPSGPRRPLAERQVPSLHLPPPDP